MQSTITRYIAPGSFRMTSNGVFVYQGSIGGVALQVRIAPVTRTSFTFTAEGSGANLDGTKNPVTVALTIGDNTGSSTVTAQFQ